MINRNAKKKQNKEQTINRGGKVTQTRGGEAGGRGGAAQCANKFCGVTAI